jgi:hypothetical protein
LPLVLTGTGARALIVWWRHRRRLAGLKDLA